MTSCSDSTVRFSTTKADLCMNLHSVLILTSHSSPLLGPKSCPMCTRASRHASAHSCACLFGTSSCAFSLMCTHMCGQKLSAGPSQIIARPNIVFNKIGWTIRELTGFSPPKGHSRNRIGASRAIPVWRRALAGGGTPSPGGVAPWGPMAPSGACWPTWGQHGAKPILS